MFEKGEDFESNGSVFSVPSYHSRDSVSFLDDLEPDGIVPSWWRMFDIDLDYLESINWTLEFCLINSMFVALAVWWRRFSALMYADLYVLHIDIHVMHLWDMTEGSPSWICRFLRFFPDLLVVSCWCDWLCWNLYSNGDCSCVCCVVVVVESVGRRNALILVFKPTSFSQLSDTAILSSKYRFPSDQRSQAASG